MKRQSEGTGSSGLPPVGGSPIDGGPGSGRVRCSTCRTLNPEGAKFCLNCGAPLVAPAPVAGERKIATVLFADVADSTRLAEGLDPEEWAEIMNGAFAFMNGAIIKYGGTIGRLMGDAVLAFFGAPVAHEDDPERAVRAGLEIRSSAMDYSKVLRATHGLDFNVRVGINTGLTVLTVVGDQAKTEYTAMGDTANVASRLQSIAGPNTVLIGADTYAQVRHIFDVTVRSAVAIKGKSVPIETFEVLAPKVTPGRARGVEGLSSPLVGRDVEYALLQDKLARLREGQGAFVGILGEAGLGKSRLVAEIRNAGGAGHQQNLIWIEGRGISYGQSISYYPWQQVIRQAVGALEKDMPATVRAKLKLAQERFGLRVEQLAFLEVLLAVEGEDSLRTVSGLDPDMLQEQIVEVMRDLFGALSRSAPTILVFDDLHWSDAASLELLVGVSGLVKRAPLLVLSLLRPDKHAVSWSFLEQVRGRLGEDYSQLVLEPLDGDMSRLLLGNLLYIEDLPEHIRSLVLRKSEGNPFFLEEVIRALMDAGYIVQENNHWRATRDIVNVAIPDTLISVLSARIDRLPEDTRRVAQAAAVIGRSFAQRVLAGVISEAPPTERVEDVSPHLLALTQEELVRERARDPELEYIFKHALTQEAAYDRLLLRRRKELHQRTAEVLERIYEDRLDEFAPLLAYHFHRSESWLPAARYAVRAGGRALTLHAVDEASDHFKTALEALDRLQEAPPEVVIDATLGWGEVSLKLRRHEELGHRQELRAQIDRALALARALGDRRRLARVLVAKGNLLTLSGTPGDAFSALHEASDLAAELGDEQLFLLPYFVTTERMVDDDPRYAAEQLGHVIELAHKYHNKGIEAHALAVQASAFARLGEFRQARDTIARALELAPQSQSLIKEADVNIVAGGVYYDLGELERGLEHSSFGTQRAVEANGFECACAGYYVTGVGKLQAVELDDALQAFREAIQLGELSRSDQMESFLNLVYAGRAFAQVATGNPDALAAQEQTLRQARAIGDKFGEAYISQTLADSYLRLGQWEHAQSHLQVALDYYRRKGMRPYIARSLDLLADVHDAGGRGPEAAQARTEAARIRAELQDAAALPAAGMPVEADPTAPSGTGQGAG